MTRKIIAIIILALAADAAHAAGEIIKLNTTGVQYCPGGRPFKFNPSNDVDLWVRIDDEFTATVFIDPGLTEPLAVLDLESSFIAPTKASFSAFAGDRFDHLAAVGTLNYDAGGSVKSLRATLIRRGVLNGCYAKAAVTGRRVN